MDLTLKLDLEEVGSRYSHYMELREAFAEGVQIMTNALEFHGSDSDRMRLKRLQHAVDAIDRRMEFLAEYDTHASQFSKLAHALNTIPPIPRPEQLAEVSDSTRKACEKEIEDAKNSNWRVPDAIKKDKKNEKGSTEDYSTGQGGAPDDGDRV